MTTRITLVLADGDPAERIELTAPLGAGGQLDPDTWAATPEAWTAERRVGDAPPLPGLLRRDADAGWALRFSSTPGDPDAPLAALAGDAAIMLGGYLSIREPDGRVRHWQVVSLG